MKENKNGTGLLKPVLSFFIISPDSGINYSKLKGMTVDVDLADGKDEVITNKENDRFSIIRNEFGTELFLEKPLNIINITDDIKKLNVDVVVLEFTTETVEDMKKVLKQLKTRKGEYREYNYKRGVY